MTTLKMMLKWDGSAIVQLSKIRMTETMRTQLATEAQSYHISLNSLIVGRLSMSLANNPSFDLHYLPPRKPRLLQPQTKDSGRSDNLSIGRVTVEATPDGRLSRKEAARYLGIQPKTLAKWATQKCGPKVIHIHSRCFYALNELDRFIRKGK